MIDDHSRVAYVEAREDETKETATEVLRNAVAWFGERGVTRRHEAFPFLQSRPAATYAAA